jgi:hypothetical protein
MKFLTRVFLNFLDVINKKFNLEKKRNLIKKIHMSINE